MKKTYNCSICNKKFLKIIDLGRQPCADTFVNSKLRANLLPKFPLQVGFCDCFHFTAINKISAYQRYQKFKYSYTADNSPVSRHHFKSIAKKLSKKIKLNRNSFVIEAGSNDGTFLSVIKKISKAKVLGVDPAKEIAEKATLNGIKTLPEFMNMELSQSIKKEHGLAKIITANNAFAHMDDLSGMLESIKALLSDDGIFVFEASYLLDVIQKILLGTIFHEHHSYHSLKPLIKFMKRFNMEIIDVERVSIQGGSLIGTAQIFGGPYKISSSVKKLVKLEEREKLDKPETIKKFSPHIIVDS